MRSTQRHSFWVSSFGSGEIAEEYARLLLRNAGQLHIGVKGFTEAELEQTAKNRAYCWYATTQTDFPMSRARVPIILW